MSLLTYPKFSVQDVSGVNLSGGMVYFYETGTAIEKDTYSDPEFTTPNTNPVILNSRGEADIYILGSYKIVLKDADDVEIWTQDNYEVTSNSQWQDSIPATFDTTTAFKVASDLTAIYEESRRIKLNDATTLYGTITSSSYFAPDTTVNVVLDSGVLSASLTGSQLSILTVSDDSIPREMTVNAITTGKGADIASATALVLGADGNSFDVTGTTPITSIATRGVGFHATLQFDNTLILTHHSTDLILPGSDNIVTAAGDIGVFYEYAAGDWRCVSYVRYSGLPINIKWTSATNISTALSIAGINGFPSLTALNSTDVAFIDDTLESLRTYRWNGYTWTLVGSGFSIAGISQPTLAALNDTDVAFIDTTLEELRTYSFNGSTWSLVGSGFSITGIGQPALTALNETDVAFIDETLEELRTYRWGGSTWTLVGSGLSITGIDNPALTTLNSTDVAFIDATIEELRTYRWSGTAWALVGSGLSLGEIGNVALTTLNSTDIVFIEIFSDTLRTYRWNGTAWALVGNITYIGSNSGVPTLASINETDVAFIDSNIDELRTYRFGFSP